MLGLTPSSFNWTPQKATVASILCPISLSLYLQAGKGLLPFNDPFVRLLTLQISLEDESQDPNSSPVDGKVSE